MQVVGGLSYPDNVGLVAWVAIPSLLEGVEEMARSLPALGLGAPESWKVAPVTGPRTEDLREAVRAAREGSARSFAVTFSGRTLFQLTPQKQGWILTLDVSPKGVGRVKLGGVMSTVATWTRQWLAAGRLVRASLERGGANPLLPDVTLVRSRSHLLTVTDAEVEAAYDRPDAFWKSGWSLHERHGDVHLLGRALDALDAASFFRAIAPQQLTLARTVKAGGMAFCGPSPDPWERIAFNEGPTYLEQVGYSEEQKTVELSARLPEGKHLSHLDIFLVRRFLENRTMADGRPIGAVRVVFQSKEMADEEKRPLLDMGAQVFYMDKQFRDVPVIA